MFTPSRQVVSAARAKVPAPEGVIADLFMPGGDAHVIRS